MSGQLHTAATSSPGKECQVHTELEAGGTVEHVGTSWRKYGSDPLTLSEAAIHSAGNKQVSNAKKKAGGIYRAFHNVLRGYKNLL